MVLSFTKNTLFTSHKTDHKITLAKKIDYFKYVHDNKWIKTHFLLSVNVLFKHTGSEKIYEILTTQMLAKKIEINSSKNYFIRHRGVIRSINTSINKA